MSVLLRADVGLMTGGTADEFDEFRVADLVKSGGGLVGIAARHQRRQHRALAVVAPSPAPTQSPLVFSVVAFEALSRQLAKFKCKQGKNLQDGV